MVKKGAVVFILFLLLGILFRFHTFERTVFGHDESTYIIISEALNQGEQLYIDRVDIKPPGIFLLYQLFLKTFSNGIFAVRFFASVFIAVTAFLIYRLSIRIWADHLIAFLSGLLYIFMFSISPVGFDANTEIFFLFFIVLGLFLTLDKEEKALVYFLFGISLGCAVLIKQVVLIEAFYFGIAAFVYLLLKKEKLRIILTKAVLYTGGVFTPIVITLVIFIQNGYVAEFLEYTWFVPGRYSSPFDFQDLSEFFIYMNTFFSFSLFPFYVVLIVGLKTWKDSKKLYLIAAFGWFLVVLIEVIVPGKFFKHYIFQFFPILSLIAPAMLLLLPRVHAYLGSHHKVSLPALIAVLWLACFVMQNHYVKEVDIPKAVAADIKPLLLSDDNIFIGKQYHIAYYLLDRFPLTKYVHPTLLSDEEHIQALNYDNTKELENIFKMSPKYVLTKGPYPIDWVEEMIQKKYSLVCWYDGTARLMILKN